jgi:hypothetical protein
MNFTASFFFSSLTLLESEEKCLCVFFFSRRNSVPANIYVLYKVAQGEHDDIRRVYFFGKVRLRKLLEGVASGL